METKVANREIISEGLTVSLYETMTLAKISFTDKIEERDEELSRMRDKCRGDMVKAAHVREKAAAVAADTATAREELTELKATFQSDEESYEEESSVASVAKQQPDDNILAAEGSLMQLEKTWISKTKLQEYGEDIDDEEEEEGDQFEVIDQGGEVPEEAGDWMFSDMIETGGGIDQLTMINLPPSLTHTPTVTSSVEDEFVEKKVEAKITEDEVLARLPKMTRDEAKIAIREAMIERQRLKTKNALLQALMVRALAKREPPLKDIATEPGICPRSDNVSLSFDLIASPPMISRSSMIGSRRSALEEQQGISPAAETAAKCRKYAEKLRQYAEERKDEIEKRQYMQERLMTLREAKTRNGAFCEELMQQFAARLREIGTGLKSSRTGNIMPEKYLVRLLDRQMRSWRALANERVSYIRTRDRTREMETKVANREIISEGLTVSLYETMTLAKISFTDKIEERDEELSRMRDKCRGDMVKAAHVREKAAAVAADTATAREELTELKATFQSLRGQVARLRQKRGAIRLEIEHTKDTHGLLLKPALLLQDYKLSMTKVDQMKVKLEQLKTEYAQIRMKLQLIRSMQMAKASKSMTRLPM
ncbi:coiled-coil domain-containing protein 96 [Ctenocephalides felis]|uniref:coiled-coil domain-containing protein 96 n=1 Tax=Ctenocephalides felis TaxID=7515 RepID=UPI000E6E102A|nr:coiled-coil domain-containing protein 96 [Ctenocephalides felis]